MNLPSSALSDSERANYEKSISSLSRASSIEKMLLWFIAIMLAIGVTFIVKTSERQVSYYQSATQKQGQLLEQIKSLETSNQKLEQDIRDSTDSVHQQINCVLEFFAQPPTQRTNSNITDPNQCIISTNGTPSSSGGATGATKSTIGAPSNSGTAAPNSAATKKNNPNSQGQNQQPKPNPNPQPKPKPTTCSPGQVGQPPNCLTLFTQPPPLACGLPVQLLNC